VLASGGLVALAKAPIKAGIKKVGTKIIQKQVIKTSIVKGTARATSFTATALTVDLAGQSIRGTRSLLEQGFRGEWNASNFTENFSYTSSNVTPGQHVARVLASGLASRGIESLWGRIPKINTASAIQASKSLQFGIGVSQTTVNTMIGRQISPLVDASMGREEFSVREAASTFVSADEWISAFDASIRGKVGGAMSGKVGGATTTRYLGKGLISALSNFNLSEADLLQLQNLESCLKQVEGGSLKNAVTDTPVNPEPRPAPQAVHPSDPTSENSTH